MSNNNGGDIQKSFWELIWKIKGLTFHSESRLTKHFTAEVSHAIIPSPIENLKVWNIKWCVDKYAKQFGIELDASAFPKNKDFSIEVADMSDEEFNVWYGEQLKLQQEYNSE